MIINELSRLPATNAEPESICVIAGVYILESHLIAGRLRALRWGAAGGGVLEERQGVGGTNGMDLSLRSGQPE